MLQQRLVGLGLDFRFGLRVQKQTRERLKIGGVLLWGPCLRDPVVFLGAC